MAKFKTKKISKVDKRPNGQYRVQWGTERTYLDGAWKGKKSFTFMGSRNFNKRIDAETFSRSKK